MAVAALLTLSPVLAQQSVGLRGAEGASPTGGLAPTGFSGNSTGSATSAEATESSSKRKPRPKQRAPRRGAVKPLPPLVSYRGAPETRTRRVASSTPPRVQPSPTTAALPGLPAPRRIAADEHPFAPVGVPVGSLRLFPFVEASLGHDSNPNRASGEPKGSAFWRGEAGFDARSDWSQHDLKVSLRGGYNEYAQDHSASRPDGAGSLAARIDMLRDTTLLFDAKFNLDTQRPGSPEITALGTRGALVEGRPLVTTTGAGLGVTQRFGAFEATLRGAVDRVAYADAKLSDGSRLDLSGQSYTSFGGSARLAYAATPGVKPFIEGFSDIRRHDADIDANGYARGSKGMGLRAGSSFELSRVLTGEASAGWNERRYDDARLGKLRGPIVDAQLIWTASPLTTVTLRAATQLSETTVAGSSGAIVRRVGVDVAHALFRNVTLGAGATYQATSYEGVALDEKMTAVTLRADYNVTRSVVVRGSFTHERLKSSAANADYTANVFLLGLRLQR